MNEDNFDDVLNELQNKISQFDNKTSNKIHFSFLKKVNFKSPFVYPVIIFFILCVFLIILKPNFTKYNSQDEQGNVTRKVSYKRLVFISLILSIVISISLYYFKLR